MNHANARLPGLVRAHNAPCTRPRVGGTCRDLGQLRASEGGAARLRVLANEGCDRLGRRCFRHIELPCDREIRRCGSQDERLAVEEYRVAATEAAIYKLPPRVFAAGRNALNQLFSGTRGGTATRLCA
jgi:hypothetical protein